VSKSKLSPVSWTELVKRLRKLGFDGHFFFFTKRKPVLKEKLVSLVKLSFLKKGL